MTTFAAVTTPALGPSWLDPNYLFTTYGAAFFGVALVFVLIECGLLFPFLPGDSLLFAIGLFIASGKPHLPSLGVALVALTAAAFLGNVTGYELGRVVGVPLYERDGRLVKRKYLDQSRAFFDKHGSKALVIGRFVPLVRTFITLVAGASRIPRRHFFTGSAIGAVLWVLVVTLLGYFLGSAFPAIGKNPSRTSTRTTTTTAEPIRHLIPARTLGRPRRQASTVSRPLEEVRGRSRHDLSRRWRP